MTSCRYNNISSPHRRMRMGVPLLFNHDVHDYPHSDHPTSSSLITSIFTYASPLWFPNDSTSSIQKLQRIQNSALRISTGCVKMSPNDYPHTET